MIKNYRKQRKENKLRKNIKKQIQVELSFNDVSRHIKNFNQISYNRETGKFDKIINKFPDDIEKEIDRRIKLMRKKKSNNQ